MIVYFYVDELSRDAITASKLKKILNQKKHHIFYGGRTTKNFLKFFHSFFDVIIFPRINFLNDEFKDSWLSWKEKIVILPNEGVGIVGEKSALTAMHILGEQFLEGNYLYAKRIDLFAVWGSNHLKTLKKYAPKMQKKFLLVGHPRYQSFNLNLEKKKKKNKKKVIGIITRGVMINDYYGRTILDLFRISLNDSKYEFYNKKKKRGLYNRRNSLDQWIIHQVIDTKNILEIIKTLSNKNFKLIVRVHPKEDIDQWKQLLPQISNSIQLHNQYLPIQDFLNKIDFVIGPPSTSFYDALMFGVEPISICSLEKKRNFFVGSVADDNSKLIKIIFKPKSINEILVYISRNKIFKMNKKLIYILKEQMNYPNCNNSLKKLVSNIEALIKTSKKKNYFLLFFRLYCEIYFLLWSIRNYFIKRKSHSAYFPLNLKTSNFIDNIEN